MKKSSLFGFLFLVAASALLLSCSKEAKSVASFSDPNEVVATIDNAKITAAELDKIAKSKLQRIEQEVYEIRKDTLDEMVDQKLLESAAAKQKKSVEEFLKENIDDKITPPTEDEVKSFYEARKEQIGSKSLKDVQEQIKAFLMQGKRQGLSQQLIGGLRSGASIKIALTQPRVEIDAGDNPSIGPKNAPVTIIEFTDYQCPFCSRVRPTIAQLLDEYKDKLRYVIRDFPLSFHQFAKKAHEAAHCAGDQGKYWEYNKELWGNQQALQPEKLKGYAKNLKLDEKKFNECLDSGKYEKKVEENVAAGAAAGAQGTPAFFVNGIFISGARPIASFKEIIDQELKK